MADLFHEAVPFSSVEQVMNTINQSQRHRYQILTKRAHRMAEYFTQFAIPANVWLGVTVELAEAKSRIDVLRGLPASIRFLSCEPLIEDLGALD